MVVVATVMVKLIVGGDYCCGEVAWLVKLVMIKVAAISVGYGDRNGEDEIVTVISSCGWCGDSGQWVIVGDGGGGDIRGDVYRSGV